jgi:uncharacterized membrane protein (UPF0136 family)
MLLAATTGLISTLGGAIGYAKSNSAASLIAGTTFGFLYFVAAYLLMQNNRNGRRLILIASAILILAMGRKALNAKPVPILMVALALSCIGFYF